MIARPQPTLNVKPGPSRSRRAIFCSSRRHQLPRVSCNAWRKLRYNTEYASLIEEPAALDMLEQARLVDLEVNKLGRVETAMVGPAHPNRDRPVFILLHGFDSSLLEFRRFHSLLSQLGDVYAVDLAGWGFTDFGAAHNPGVVLGAEQKREHLHAFWKEVVGARPAVVVGNSLGGTIALDYALHYPHAVEKLVLVDAQGFIDGLGLLPKMPRWVLELSLKVLQSDWLRQTASKMAYHNKARCATDDARRIGKLHTLLPGWVNANIAFMRSGGYSISKRIPEVGAPTLVVWGRQDEILEPSTAHKFVESLPNARLEWVEECGHVAHLEQPERLYELVAEFVGEGASSVRRQLADPVQQLA